jgi:hypothetical protein
VQGEHLTVTPTSCFLCHFKGAAGAAGNPAEVGSRRLNDCNLCHGPPTDAIQLGDFTFRHSDYLKRGVECASCHGDVTRGDGEVPRERCGSCHNEQGHFEKYDDVEFVHRKHVTEHSVSCLHCHAEIRHGLPAREEHFRGDCSNCHVDTHGAPAGVYQGAGGRDVPDNPAAMYLARVTCNGCHRPPFPGAPSSPATFAADPLACLDCHGPGFEGMAERWQAEARGGFAKANEALKKLFDAIEEGGEDPVAARRHYDDAAWNVGLAQRDGSDGVHNLPYVRDLLRKASEQVKAGFDALEPGARAPSIPVGPRVGSKEGCTNLCHVGVEEGKLDRAHELPFPHAVHLLKAKLDCSQCHAREPHGTTLVERADCVSCHHKGERVETCAACHADVARLRAETPEGVEPAPMADLDCLACHAGLAERKPLRESVMAACDECHEADEKDFAAKHYDEWKKAAAAPVEAALAGASPEARAALEALLRTGPFHNPAAAKAAAKAK